MSRNPFLISLVFSFLLCLSLIVSVKAVSGWSKTYGGAGDDVAYSLIATSDGGFALAGVTSSFGAGDSDAWLVRTDDSGRVLWNKTYGGTSSDIIYALVNTSDGGYAIAGKTKSFGHMNSEDAWLVKMDAAGNAHWNKTYGGDSDDVAYSLVVTPDDGYALAGYSGGDFWLVKTDSSGNMKWDKTYNGAGDDIARSLVLTSDGGYALAGATGWTEPDGGEFWLIKTNSTGNAEWNRTYGGTGNEMAYSLVATSDGGYALAGSWNAYIFGGPMSVSNNPDCWLVKTNSSGSMQWNRTYGGAASDRAYSLIQTSDGGYALAGTYSYMFYQSLDNLADFAFTGDFYLVKTDSLGNMLWNRTYGGSTIDEAYSLAATSDGGFALAGVTAVSNNVVGNVWLVKTDAAGVVPEFSSWLIPLLILTAIAFVIINVRSVSQKRPREK